MLRLASLRPSRVSAVRRPCHPQEDVNHITPTQGFNIKSVQSEGCAAVSAFVLCVCVLRVSLPAAGGSILGAERQRAPNHIPESSDILISSRIPGSQF